MKYLTESEKNRLDAGRMAPTDTFSFRCHEGLACFNRCCHNLNLFLYPYDVLRIKKLLNITADVFLEHYADVVLREADSFFEVLLRMAEGSGKPCIFLSAQGCRIYEARPHTCRLFPIEQGVYFNAALDRSIPLFYFRPPEFCLGPTQDNQQTMETYVRSQQAEINDQMTTQWADIRRRMQANPWGNEGPRGAKAKMAFMAAYNMESFRAFVFQSTFLKRYHVPAKVVKQIRKSDTALLSFGFDWIKLFLWGLPSKQIKN